MAENGEGKADETREEEGAPSHPWEEELKVYSLREPGEDPRWAVRTVWTWVGITLFSLAFVVALIVLGFFYD